MLRKRNPQIFLNNRFQMILAMRQYRSIEVAINREGSYLPSSIHIIQKTFIPVELSVELWFSVKGDFAPTGGYLAMSGEHLSVTAGNALLQSNGQKPRILLSTGHQYLQQIIIQSKMLIVGLLRNLG